MKTALSRFSPSAGRSSEATKQITAGHQVMAGRALCTGQTQRREEASSGGGRRH